MNELSEFIELSKYAGMREDLIQAGGGNTSVKIDKEKMYIKSSGVQLSDINDTGGYSVVNYRKLSDYLFSDYLEKMNHGDEKNLLEETKINGLRPSIETFLHAVTDIFTLHTHPIAVNAITSRKDSRKIILDLFPNSVFIPYATPGIELAKSYINIFSKNKTSNFDVIFLENHGLIISGKTSAEVIDKTEIILKKIEQYLNINYMKYHRVTEIYNIIKQLPYFNKDEIVFLSNHTSIISAFKLFNKFWNYQFCPDCLVYCNKKPLYESNQLNVKVIQNHIKQFGKPVIIAYKNYIYILASGIKKAKEIESILAFSAEVCMINKNEELSLLSEKEQDILLNWELEKDRQKF